MESKEKINQLYELKRALGLSFLDCTTILFSCSDDLEGKAFKDFIKEGGKEFCDMLKQCGGRCHCWNNRDNRSDEEIEKLLKDLKKELQKKFNVIYEQNNKELYTKEHFYLTGMLSAISSLYSNVKAIPTVLQNTGHKWHNKNNQDTHSNVCLAQVHMNFCFLCFWPFRFFTFRHAIS